MLLIGLVPIHMARTCAVSNVTSGQSDSVLLMSPRAFAYIRILLIDNYKSATGDPGVMTMHRPLIWCGIPAARAYIRAELHCWLLHQVTHQKDWNFRHSIEISSLLTWNCNRALQTARHNRADYFLMIHTDVVPEDNAIDKMLDIMSGSQCDVLSVALPLRHMPSESSAAMQTSDGMRRLRLEEIGSGIYCPPTSKLRINTGLIMIDLHTRARGIVWTSADHVDDTGHVWNIPEDWLMSIWLEEQGIKFGTTCAVKAWHEAALMLSNQHNAQVRVARDGETS